MKNPGRAFSQLIFRRESQNHRASTWKGTGFLEVPCFFLSNYHMKLVGSIIFFILVWMVKISSLSILPNGKARMLDSWEPDPNDPLHECSS